MPAVHAAPKHHIAVEVIAETPFLSTTANRLLDGVSVMSHSHSYHSVGTVWAPRCHWENDLTSTVIVPGRLVALVRLSSQEQSLMATAITSHLDSGNMLAQRSILLGQWPDLCPTVLQCIWDINIWFQTVWRCKPAVSPWQLKSPAWGEEPEPEGDVITSAAFLQNTSHLETAGHPNPRKSYRTQSSVSQKAQSSIVPCLRR